VIAYRAMLDVPRELVMYVSRLLAAERRARGTRKKARALTCFRQALFGLVWFRKREDLTVLGVGFGISRATAYRYRDEVVAVLAAQAPDLTQALDRVQAEGWAYVILDGKVVDTDRYREKTISRKGETIDLWYSGKRHDFGGNIQAVMRPDGLPIWVSAVEPGSVHDLVAAHEHALGSLYAAAARGLPTLADPGYEGAGHGVYTPFKQPSDGRRLGVDNRTYNKLLRSMRCIGERGFALLSQRWRVLQHVTACPHKIGDIANAALMLTHFEHRYLPR
jgi:DDE superfamily endonuclease/Helix-turn-helix of DDE superfamily endonuclease